ncbi:tRNA (adenosine(37)-N6)-dimethylallyltransferase MiaA [Candidatus Azambacteria bacterium]|nr:tRNA (adenosine(37)-N6)-dimethylallyltransferase MiaA [Candidatus Azambacteria bacterium]
MSSPRSKTVKKQAIIVILGPTASGKSALAVKLAKKFNGEVISADSRQVYKGMNIGTGKITKTQMRGVRHHLLDVASPKKIYDVVEWKKRADKAVADIARRGKFPIVCGGTGLYIKALIENVAYPDVPPDWKLRKKLDAKSPRELFLTLKKLDPARAKTIDSNNPRRLARAIEIAKALGKVPAMQAAPRYNALIIGIKKSPRELQRAIAKRLDERIKKGMAAEARRLHAGGVSFKRMEEIGLEYKYLALYLQGKMSKEEMMQTLNIKIWQYARRQMTWFRNTPNVRWIATPGEAEKLAQVFLKT